MSVLPRLARCPAIMLPVKPETRGIVVKLFPLIVGLLTALIGATKRIW